MKEEIQHLIDHYQSRVDKEIDVLLESLISETTRYELVAERRILNNVIENLEGLLRLV